MSVILQSSGGGQITIQEPATASNFTQTLPAASGTVALLQTPSFATTIGVGGAIPAVSGAGITFPATQSASSDANTLDDYEEGSFTSTVGYDGGSFSQAGGRYTKIGRLIYFSITLQWNAAAGSGNTLRTMTLPFSGASGITYAVTAGLIYKMNTTSTNTVSTGGFVATSNIINLYLSVWGTTEGYMRFIDSGSYVRISGTYEV